MKVPTELYTWDFPHTTQVPDGYDMKSVPDLTRGNLLVLIEAHNELVRVIRELVPDALAEDD